MSDDGFRFVIRSGLAPMIDEVDEGPDWDEVMSQFHQPWHRRLPGWATAVAAAFAVLIGLGGLSLALVGGSGSPTATTVPSSPASVAELISAVTAAADRLHTAPGYEAIQRSFIDGYLAVSTWVSVRPTGDMVAVQSVDRDVRDTGWWLGNGAVPPDEGNNIATTVTVRADGDSQRTGLSTQTGEVWAPLGSQIRITPVAFDLAQLDTTDWLTASPAKVTVSRGEKAQVWIATAAYGDGTIVARWTLGTDGTLQSWSGRLMRNGPVSSESTDPTDSWTIDFTTLVNPDPIDAPQLDSSPDLSALGLPADFPLPADVAPPTTRPTTMPATPGFDPTSAEREATQWWNAVIDGDLGLARRIASPDAGFNYAGIREAVHQLGTPLNVQIDQENRFGTEALPRMCFKIDGPGGSFEGSNVFRQYQGEWMLWEIRPNETPCVTQTTQPTLGFDHEWGLAYPPDWYRADSEVMPYLGFRSITVSTAPISLGGRCAQMPDNALRHMSTDDVLLTVFFQGATRGDFQPLPESLDDATFPVTDRTAAESCSGRTDLEIHLGSFGVGGQDVSVLLAFGPAVDPSVRQTAWDVLGSLQNLGHVDGGNPGVCVVTLPGVSALTPPDPYNPEPSTYPRDAWYGTDQLWTALSRDGSYKPRKSVWWSSSPGVMIDRVIWQRLDAPTDPITAFRSTNAYRAEDGDFIVAGFDPDTPGCWRVAATYRGASLSYVYASH